MFGHKSKYRNFNFSKKYNLPSDCWRGPVDAVLDVATFNKNKNFFFKHLSVKSFNLLNGGDWTTYMDVAFAGARDLIRSYEDRTIFNNWN